MRGPWIGRDPDDFGLSHGVPQPTPVVTVYRIKKRELRTSRANVGQVIPQGLQHAEPISKRRGALVIKCGGGSRHFLPQLLKQLIIFAVKKGAGRLHLAVVAPLRTKCRARAKASANLKTEASGRQRFREKLLLIGEDHFLLLRAVAQAKAVVDATDCFANLRQPRDGAVPLERGARRRAREEDIRRRAASQTKVRVTAAPRIVSQVEARLAIVDEF